MSLHDVKFASGFDRRAPEAFVDRNQPPKLPQQSGIEAWFASRFRARRFSEADQGLASHVRVDNCTLLIELPRQEWGVGSSF